MRTRSRARRRSPTVPNSSRRQRTWTSRPSSALPRITSNNQPDWATQLGWYLDFPSSSPPAITPPDGERLVYPANLVNRRLNFVTTIPNTDPCQFGGTSPQYVIDALTGARFAESAFDINNDGIFNASDLVLVGGVYVPVSAIFSPVGITPTPTIIRAGASGGLGAPGGATGPGGGSSGGTVDPTGTAYSYTPGSTGNNAVLRLNLGAGGAGRLTWREVIND